ncbi:MULTISPECIES: glycosyltransferase family 10 domain-containing protein [unclassified Thioalkalivibrio]|uniref:glycosyltransferase family 10 domain-containing protein n=1 Tax=unclassified Thioalkalivibrio TaxID=2621013 RepID=UPI000368A622|nr:MULTISPECIES: glycosyltransferase family 10 [unclassified Thioalkalivibrio]
MSDSPTDRIRVKFLSTMREAIWRHQLPDGEARWGRCEFTFDPQATEYDWLVVYDEFPSNTGRNRHYSERLACGAEHTLLVTMEPPSIKSYGRRFTRQFGRVLTSHPEWALKHRRRIHSQQGMIWYYGFGSQGERPYNDMRAHPPLEKSRDIATMCSAKRQWHTLHRRRYDFTWALKAQLPELEIFGKGVQPLDDKAECLDAYRYHVAVENYVGPHHWTEKLADAFLGATLPFYYGAPNAADYFPPESFIAIDIDDVEGTAERIRRAIRDNEYEQRLPHILEARRRVLEEYNQFAVVARIIDAAHDTEPAGPTGQWIHSRRALRRRDPLAALEGAWEKLTQRIGHISGRAG